MIAVNLSLTAELVVLFGIATRTHQWGIACATSGLATGCCISDTHTTGSVGPEPQIFHAKSPQLKPMFHLACLWDLVHGKMPMSFAGGYFSGFLGSMLTTTALDLGVSPDIKRFDQCVISGQYTSLNITKFSLGFGVK